jgi:DNA-binding NarL/FixJ family response regulator
LEQVRVILVEMPEMLRAIVKEVMSDEDDLEIVDEDDGDAAVATIREGGACVVITQRDDRAGQSIDRFLGAGPGVRVLALSTDGRDGAVYELQPEKHLLGEISPPLLLAAIRDPLGDPGTTRPDAAANARGRSRRRERRWPTWRNEPPGEDRHGRPRRRAR